MWLKKRKSRPSWKRQNNPVVSVKWKVCFPNSVSKLRDVKKKKKKRKNQQNLRDVTNKYLSFS